jgi:RNA repair, ligase-Pnkp-associating, region of Hen1/PNKP adenylyltransferase domain, C-terminal region
MLLTLTLTRPPATDLGFLLHKHPDRVQRFSLPFGAAHVFYPEAESSAARPPCFSRSIPSDWSGAASGFRFSINTSTIGPMPHRRSDGSALLRVGHGLADPRRRVAAVVREGAAAPCVSGMPRSAQPDASPSPRPSRHLALPGTGSARRISPMRSRSVSRIWSPTPTPIVAIAGLLRASPTSSWRRSTSSRVKARRTSTSRTTGICPSRFGVRGRRAAASDRQRRGRHDGSREREGRHQMVDRADGVRRRGHGGQAPRVHCPRPQGPSPARCEGPRQGVECCFGVLALESEPVDPRL